MADARVFLTCDGGIGGEAPGDLACQRIFWHAYLVWSAQMARDRIVQGNVMRWLKLIGTFQGSLDLAGWMKSEGLPGVMVLGRQGAAWREDIRQDAGGQRRLTSGIC